MDTKERWAIMGQSCYDRVLRGLAKKKPVATNTKGGPAVEALAGIECTGMRQLL